MSDLFDLTSNALKLHVDVIPTFVNLQIRHGISTPKCTIEIKPHIIITHRITCDIEQNRTITTTTYRHRNLVQSI